MPVTHMPERTDDISDLGRAWYEKAIRPTLTAADIGKFVAIDVDTGEYEIDTDDYTAVMRLHDRRDGIRAYMVRVGYKAAQSFGYREVPSL